MHTEPRQRRILFVLSHAPYNQSLARDCLDAAMTAALLNQSVGLLFIAEGIYHLAESGAAAGIQTLQELAPVALYLVKQDVEARQLQLEGVDPADVTVLDAAQVAALMDQYDRVLSF
jgi:tRNA 2-thiouridine synthesizing protein C